MVKVSIIVPVYNKEKYLKECIDSILGQSLREIEVVCIDDGSTDGSMAVLEQYAGADRRVKAASQENAGVSAARNRGIDMAEGEFLMFMDPDDYYPSADIVEDLYAAAKRENAAICGGSFSECHEGGIRTRWTGIYEDYTFGEDRMTAFAEYQFDYGFHRFLYSAELIKSNSIYFPGYIRFQDPPFMVRAMLAAGRFYAMKKTTYCYRWGHQELEWHNRRVNDLVRGISDNVQAACSNGLPKLLYLNYRRVTEEYFSRIKNCMTPDNLELVSLLLKLNGMIDTKLLMQTVPECGAVPLHAFFVKEDRGGEVEKLARKADELEGEIERIYHSKTYRAGKAALYLPRKVRGIFHKNG